MEYSIIKPVDNIKQQEDEYNILHCDNMLQSVNSIKYQEQRDPCIPPLSPLSLSNPDDKDDFKYKFIAVGLGNFLEYYDFSVFGSLIDIFAVLFFPSSESSFLISLAIYGSAFVMRPLGGIIIGWIGDHFARKRALEISICLMIVPSFLMGLLPTYHSLGYAMTFLLVILRLTQGLAVGGELIGAFIVILESSATQQNQGFYGASTKATCFLGSATGMGLVAFLRLVLTHEQMLSWGWRLPFLIGIVFGAIGLYLRSKLKEEPSTKEKVDYENTDYSFESIDIPLVKKQNSLWDHLTDVILVIIATSFWSVSYYTCMIWISYYLADRIGEKAFLLTFCITLLMIILFPLSGLLADKLGKYLNDGMMGIRYTMMIATVLMIVLSLPAMYLITYKGTQGVIGGLVMLMISVTLYGSCLPAFIISRFPREIRYLACGISYNISNAIFASTAPMIASFLVDSSNRESSKAVIDTLLYDSTYRPMYYLIVISIIVFISLAMIPIIEKDKMKLVSTI